jgi:membrane protease YdiL (CAAX protease family)
MNHPIFEFTKTVVKIMHADPVSPDRARKGLIIYLGCIVVGSTPLLWRIVDVGLPVEDGRQLPLVVALMWVPALSSFATRLIMREGVRDVSFRLGGWTGFRAVLGAVLFPVAAGALAYGAAWTSRLTEFVSPQYGLFPAFQSTGVRFALAVLFAATAGSLIGIITSAGEEIGWRGYMVSRLVQAGVPRPLLLSGIIWGLWHVPGILSGQYAAGPNRWLSAALFLVLAVSLSVLWGRMRLTTGSVWPAVLGHSAWNAVIEGPFTSYTRGTDMSLWLGESGILLVLVVALSVWWLTRRASILQRRLEPTRLSPATASGQGDREP